MIATVCTNAPSRGVERSTGPEHSGLEPDLADGYDGGEVRLVVYVMQVSFWTSVPLFAMYLLVSWALSADPFASWPGIALWLVVLASSAYLAPQAFPPVSDEGMHSEPRASETLVYPIILLLGVL